MITVVSPWPGVIRQEGLFVVKVIIDLQVVLPITPQFSVLPVPVKQSQVEGLHRMVRQQAIGKN